jgi:hypothetical protein
VVGGLPQRVIGGGEKGGVWILDSVGHGIEDGARAARRNATTVAP